MNSKPGWLDKKEYPFTSHFLNIDGHQMHYIDEGEGVTLLFIHGTPSWSFEYRKIIQALSKSFRCIALDHIGFGLSDKPKSYDYSLEQHCRNLDAFIDVLRLRDFVIVLHDFGGPIGLHYVVNHPQNIKKIILFNTWAWDPGKDISAWLLKSSLLAFLYKQFNFSARYLLPASFGEKKLSKEIVRQYCKPFRRSSERNGPVAFARSLATKGEWFNDLWKALHSVRNTPVMFIWGMKDRFINPCYLHRLSSAFAEPVIMKLATAGHFPQEESPVLVSDFIRSFVGKDLKVLHHDSGN